MRKRFTIVGLWGGYILKPASPELHEVEDLTMHRAEIASLKVMAVLRFFTFSLSSFRLLSNDSSIPMISFEAQSLLEVLLIQHRVENYGLFPCFFQLAVINMDQTKFCFFLEKPYHGTTSRMDFNTAESY